MKDGAPEGERRQSRDSRLTHRLPRTGESARFYKRWAHFEGPPLMCHRIRSRLSAIVSRKAGPRTGRPARGMKSRVGGTDGVHTALPQALERSANARSDKMIFGGCRKNAELCLGILGHPCSTESLLLCRFAPRRPPPQQRKTPCCRGPRACGSAVRIFLAPHPGFTSWATLCRAAKNAALWPIAALGSF